jgi:hypothetical protein
MAVAKCGAVVRMAAFGGACAGDTAGAMATAAAMATEVAMGTEVATAPGTVVRRTTQFRMESANHTVATEKSEAAVIAAASFF